MDVEWISFDFHLSSLYFRRNSLNSLWFSMKWLWCSIDSFDFNGFPFMLTWFPSVFNGCPLIFFVFQWNAFGKTKESLWTTQENHGKLKELQRKAKKNHWKEKENHWTTKEIHITAKETNAQQRNIIKKLRTTFENQRKTIEIKGSHGWYVASRGLSTNL